MNSIKKIENKKVKIIRIDQSAKRSAVSIPSNIAEGFARFHNKEADKLLNEIDEISKMTMSLIKKLNSN